MPVVSYCRLDHIFFHSSPFSHHAPSQNKLTNNQPRSWAQQVRALAMKPEDMWPPCGPHERRLLEVVLWPPLVCCGTHYHPHTHWINLVNSTAVCNFIYSTCVNVCVWVCAHIFVPLVLRPGSIAGSMQAFLSSEFQTFPPYTPKLLILCITKIFPLDTSFGGRG